MSPASSLRGYRLSMLVLNLAILVRLLKTIWQILWIEIIPFLIRLIYGPITLITWIRQLN